MEKMGADSICIKDMSGLLTPYKAYELVKSIKNYVNVPLEVHSHCTTGLADMMYIKAIEAGADIVDTAISPFGLGTSQPPTEPLVATLKDTEYATGLSEELLSEAYSYFNKIREEALASGKISTKVLGANIKGLQYQVPGGMLSNLVSQLSLQNNLHLLPNVLEEVPRVRKDLGYPPLVTPTSQMVGAQALINVMAANRYQMVPAQIKDYVRGMYGKSTVPMDENFIKQIIGDEKPITCRPADLLEDMFEAKKAECTGMCTTNEDVLSYILFPEPAKSFFENKK